MEPNNQQPTGTTKTQASFPMGLLAIVLIVVLGVGILVYRSRSKGDAKTNSNTNVTMEVEEKKPSEDTNTMQKESTGSAISPEANNTMSEYKDGKYEAIGNYKSPAGQEEIDVQLTLKNGTIADANVISKATKPKSVMFQNKFISGYKSMVVGKNISEVKLDVVSGSSLTPKGFNDALEKIKTQAKS